MRLPSSVSAISIPALPALQSDGLAPGLLQHFGGILDALAAPGTVLVPFNVIGPVAVPFRLAIHQGPIHLELIILRLGGSKAPFVSDFDVFEDIDPARIAFLILGFGQLHLLSVLSVTDRITDRNARKCEKNIGSGGERGIRTPDTRKGMPAFEAGAFNHSAISPRLNGSRKQF